MSSRVKWEPKRNASGPGHYDLQQSALRLPYFLDIVIRDETVFAFRFIND